MNSPVSFLQLDEIALTAIRNPARGDGHRNLMVFVPEYMSLKVLDDSSPMMDLPPRMVIDRGQIGFRRSAGFDDAYDRGQYTRGAVEAIDPMTGPYAVEYEYFWQCRAPVVMNTEYLRLDAYSRVRAIDDTMYPNASAEKSHRPLTLGEARIVWKRNRRYMASANDAPLKTILTEPLNSVARRISRGREMSVEALDGLRRTRNVLLHAVQLQVNGTHRWAWMLCEPVILTELTLDVDWV